MPQARLEPGGRPPKHLLKPVKGKDGIYRLNRVRHRTVNGEYVRTSGSGRTSNECLANWEENFDKNRVKGTVRTGRGSASKRFTAEDLMLDVFKDFLDLQKKRVRNGEIAQGTCDDYEAALFISTGPKSSENALKLEKELGQLTIREVGDTAFLCDYLDEIAAIAPGLAKVHYTILTTIFKRLTVIGPFKYSPMLPVPNPANRGGKQKALKAADRDAVYDLVLTRQTRAPYRVMLFLLLLGTGIRIGEALALRWMDIDLRAGTERAVIHVCGTVCPSKGGTSIRKDGRKNGGPSYYLTLPGWLTLELRQWKRDAGDVAETDHILRTQRGGFPAVGTAEYLWNKVVADTPYEWVKFGNFRDTAATHVKGKTNEPLRASAQLGHSEASTIATVHYIDREGYIQPAVDNADAMESLKPSKLEQNWNPRPLWTEFKALTSAATPN